MSRFGWAVFLGMSWTWCIGMFLPVLLVRDYGFWGWVVFAVPNVVGAAAMGWVLRDGCASARIVNHHVAACTAFSVITILFQIMFVSGVVRPLIGSGAGLMLLTGGLLTVFVALRFRSGDVLMAWVVFGVSISAFVLAAHSARHLRWHVAAPAASGNRVAADLLMLAPVCVFGFLLCPYLDLTFHRARQATGTAGAMVFGVGFGGPFLLMILFTLWYAPLLASLPRALSLPPNLRWAIGVHLCVQCAYTVGLHFRELTWPMDTSTAGVTPNAGKQKLAGLLLGLIGGLVPHLLASTALRAGYQHPSPGEMTYRLFLSFYGLVFPAYVWLCMIPARHHKAGPTRLEARALAIITLAAGPMYWKGFIDGAMVWLLPAVAIVLLARLILRSSGDVQPEPREGVST